jgi:hypothetical protein
VAIGDIHGDLQALKVALRTAGVLHATRDTWIGGRTVVVQVGDQLDRGDDELAILALIRKLQRQAKHAGGALHVLFGNHEHIASSTQGFRYATKGTYANFARWEAVCREKGRLSAKEFDEHHCELYQGPLMCPMQDHQCQAVIQRVPREVRSRFLALYPGGCIAKGVLARERAGALIVGDTLFVHAGLSTQQLSQHERAQDAIRDINLEMSLYFSGGVPQLSENTMDVIWTRDYGQAVDRRVCNDLQRTLAMLPGNVTRIVVGHTIQPGHITSACDGAAWRIDVGMSRGTYGTRPQVLEILPGGRVKVLESQETHAAGGRLRKAVGSVIKTLGTLKRWFTRSPPDEL